MDQPTANHAHYEGWTLLELYGHNTEFGFCATEYFGGVAMLRVDVPEIPAAREKMNRPSWQHIDGQSKLCPVGTEIDLAPIPGRTRYLGFGAIYSMNPSTEEGVRAAILRSRSRDVLAVHLPPGVIAALPQTTADAQDAEVDEELENETEDEISF